MTVSRHRVEAVMRFKDVKGGLVVYSSLILQKMSGNAYFPNAVPPLSELATATDELREAEASAEIGGPADTTIRDGKKGDLIALLKLLCAWVEYIANKSPEAAIAMIESSGFDVKRSTHPGAKDLIRVVEGPVSGTVIIYVKMPAKDARIHYQASADDGETWTDLAQIQNAKYTATGLTPGKTYLFRFLYLLRDNVLRQGCDPREFLVK